MTIRPQPTKVDRAGQKPLRALPRVEAEDCRLLSMPGSRVTPFSIAVRMVFSRWWLRMMRETMPPRTIARMNNQKN